MFNFKWSLFYLISLFHPNLFMSLRVLCVFSVYSPVYNTWVLSTAIGFCVLMSFECYWKCGFMFVLNLIVFRIRYNKTYNNVYDTAMYLVKNKPQIYLCIDGKFLCFMMILFTNCNKKQKIACTCSSLNSLPKINVHVIAQFLLHLKRGFLQQ